MNPILAGMLTVKERQSLLSADELRQLQEWNATEKEYPPVACLHHFFEAAVDRGPDFPALVFADKVLTYRELEERANQLAHYLRSVGVEREQGVALLMERSLEMVVAIYGILKAGGAYIPLDPEHPVERLEGILEEARPEILLTQECLIENVFPVNIKSFCLDSHWDEIAKYPIDRPSCTVGPSNLAYIIYTSGSTGKPKGVMNEHRGICNRLQWMQDAYCLTEKEAVLQKTPYTFDVSVWEFFWPLMVGCRLVIAQPGGHRDGMYLIDTIEQHHITTLHFVPSMLEIFLEVADRKTCQSLQRVFVSGEALSKSLEKRYFQVLDAPLYNLYGPTEAAVDVTHWTCSAESDLPFVPIGKPIANTTVYILDKDGRQVPIGKIGELYIGGVQVARGYLERPDLTAESFLSDPFDNRTGARLYKTGDLVRFLPDGNIEYLGREDFQVKINGLRIELAEIEEALKKIEFVKQAAVTCDKSEGRQRLIAYIVLRENTAAMADLPANLRESLKKALPVYMIPHVFVELDSMPLSSNGKLDRKALPPPEINKGNAAGSSNRLSEQYILDMWKTQLSLNNIGLEERFFEIGGTSLDAISFIVRLSKELGERLPTVLIFDAPTIRQFTDRLWQNYSQVMAAHFPDEAAHRDLLREKSSTFSKHTEHDDVIAIIGMAGRFPGANNIDEFWQNLIHGKESIRFFSDEELSSLVQEKEKKDPRYIPARGVLEAVDQFDADFFEIPPVEAQVMDPQQRIFLELCWEALENSGYTPENYSGAIGVYGGMNNNTYYLNYVLARPDAVEKVGPFQVMLANEKDFLTTRVSYKLNLKGPSENIYTACSTGLVAVVEGFQALLDRQCDMALAGGISVIVPQNSGYLYQEGGMLSPDGHCRPFSSDAQGTTFNNGAGLVVLKRYKEALADNDHIYALIRGTGINNDGGGKISFTAPSVQGQTAAIKMALAQADVPAESISYVETHGTATPLGDPIEVSALAEALSISPDKGKTCMLGSVKSNIGHLIHAAGVTGLIKTALALEKEIIPPTINHKSPNPEINWQDTPFSVCTRLTPWPAGKTIRRAGVSSLGVGGTNAHVILEEFAQPDTIKSSERPAHLVPLAARSLNSLQQQAENLSRYLQDCDVPLEDIAYTLQNGRKHFDYRMFGVFTSRQEISEMLAAGNKNRLRKAHTSERNPSIIFMFPGQGAQHLNMGSGIYKHDSVFRDTIDRGALLLHSELGEDIRSIIISDDAEKLRQTAIAQPALFLLEYALAEMWEALGVRPAAMIGHSIGELTAACLAGVFSFEEGLQLVARRGKLMQQCPPGSMLSVRLPASVMKDRLFGGLVLSTVNAPELCVIGGQDDEISTLQETLQKEKVPCRILHTSHAFHSPAMMKAADEFVKVMEQVKLSPPDIPFISCISGTWITTEQALSPAYWAEQIRQTVQISRGFSQIVTDYSNGVFLEVGPRMTMATLLRQHDPAKSSAVISTLEGADTTNREYVDFLNGCGQLWLSGVDLHWQQLYREEMPHRTPLPTYPFERKRYWLDSAPVDENTRIGYHERSTSMNPGYNETAASQQEMEQDVTMLHHRIVAKLIDIIEESSGIAIEDNQTGSSFLDLGFDSLLLTQIATIISNNFNVEVLFRQLMEEQKSVESLAEYVAANGDGLNEMFSEESPSVQLIPSSSSCSQADESAIVTSPVAGHGLEAVLSQQLQILNRQLDILTGTKTAFQPAPAMSSTSTDSIPPASSLEKLSVVPENEKLKKQKAGDDKTEDGKKPFGPAAKISTSSDAVLSSDQQKNLQTLVDSYTAKTAGSRNYTDANRVHLADPRAVSGFQPLFKEIVYPIVVKQSKGVRLIDIDDNEYVDMLNGYGSNFLGFTNELIMQAVAEQMSKGVEIGPQHPLAGEVAGLMREMTGLDRFAFCNTGSEAVLGCTRLARTVTGRKTIVMFHGAYHGIFDEVIVRGTPALKSFPGAPGIMPESVQNTLVLEYGSPESLKIIKERSNELAAVLVEPVQSRNPSLQPRDFLRELRSITRDTGIALIMDEVITGFRIDPGGAQSYFGVKADLATYGKVIGGGLPIGVIGGISRFMDALDGGQWQYGDDSFPEVGVTYFAGTFVRHPMALAAARAVLLFLREKGRELQKAINSRADQFARTLNNYFAAVHAPMKISNFGSLMKIDFTDENPLNELVYCYMRQKGVHIWDGRPIFLTLAHSDDDLEFVLKIFKESIAEMQSAGFFPKSAGEVSGNVPPVPGACLGKTPDGTPAWFVADPHRPGKYIQLEEP